MGANNQNLAVRNRGLHTTGEALAMVPGLTIRRLHYWREHGCVRATHEDHGSGSRLGWSQRDLNRLYTICRVQQNMVPVAPSGLGCEAVRMIWQGLETKDTAYLPGMLPIKLMVLP